MKQVTKAEYSQHLRQYKDAEIGIHGGGYVVHHYAEQIIAAEKNGEYYINENFGGANL